MRAFARGGCQTLGLRVGRLCCNHGRPFLYGLAYVTRLPTSPGRPRDRFRVHPQASLWLHLDAGTYRLGIVRWFALREWWERNADGVLSRYDTRSFRQGRRSLDTIDVRSEDLTGNPFEHSLDVFLNHYGDDPKLLVLTLETLDAFQQNWFGSVVEGKPEIVQRHGVVITTALMDRLIRGDESARALVKASTGLDDDGLVRLISTEDHDPPVGTACTDITHPPFADAIPGE